MYNKRLLSRKLSCHWKPYLVPYGMIFSGQRNILKLLPGSMITIPDGWVGNFFFKKAWMREKKEKVLKYGPSVDIAFKSSDDILSSLGDPAFSS